MAKISLLVTEVTQYGASFCVAGWDSAASRMVRPLPPGSGEAEASHFWAAQFAGVGKAFDVGNEVLLVGAPVASYGMPHATEDWLVSSGPVPVKGHGENAVPFLASGSVYSLMATAFGAALTAQPNDKWYVDNGQGIRSLAALELSPGDLDFFETSFQGGRKKLRVRVTEKNNLYDCSVASDPLNQIWVSGGLAAVRAKFSGHAGVHIRFGLARKMPQQQNRCFLQVNGICPK